MKKFLKELNEINSSLSVNINRSDLKKYAGNYPNFTVLFGFLKFIDSTLSYSRQFNKNLFDEFKFSDDSERSDFNNFLNIYSKYRLKDIEGNEGIDLGYFKGLYKKLDENYVFKNGEKIGFYNFSGFNLKNLVEDKNNFKSNLNDYILSFSPNIYKILFNLNVFNLFDILKECGVLYDYFEKLASIDFNFNNCSNHETLINSYEEWINEVFNISFFKKNYSTFSNDMNELLTDLLFVNEDFKYNEIDILTPNYINGFSFNKSEKIIKKLNPNCMVNFYEQEEDSLLYVLFLIKLLFNNKNLDNYIKSGDINKHDYILLDLLNSNINPADIYGYLSNLYGSLKENSKLIFVIPSYFDTNNILQTYMSNDTLETVILVPNKSVKENDFFYIVIINKNKERKRKYKIQLIDLNYSKILSNNYDFKEKIRSIIFDYENFNQSFNSLILSIKRFDVDEFDITKELYLIHNSLFSKDYDNIKELNQICELKNFNLKDRDVDSLLICTSKENNSKIRVFNSFEINQIDEKNYIICQVTSEEILSDYLKIYLNSNNGLYGFNLLSTDFRDYFTIPLLNLMKIPIPSLNEQKKIINANMEFSEFKKEIDLLENTFSNNLMNYENPLKLIKQYKSDSSDMEFILGGLIWPLAILYIDAKKRKFNISDELNNYLYLFEFLTEFTVIVLLSGIPDEEYKKLKNTIFKPNYHNKGKDNYESYKKMMWGGWVFLLNNLQKVYVENDFKVYFGMDFYRELSSDKNINLMNDVKEMRNAKQHQGKYKEYKEEQLLEMLKPKLDSLYDYLFLYKNFSLFYTTGNVNADDDQEIYIHDIIDLTGATQPLETLLTLNKRLKSHRLYLYNQITKECLQLNENYIKYIKKENHYILYIFNSLDYLDSSQKNKPYKEREYEAVYISFQDETDTHKEVVKDYQGTFINLKNMTPIENFLKE